MAVSRYMKITGRVPVLVIIYNMGHLKLKFNTSGTTFFNKIYDKGVPVFCPQQRVVVNNRGLTSRRSLSV